MVILKRELLSLYTASEKIFDNSCQYFLTMQRVAEIAAMLGYADTAVFRTHSSAGQVFHRVNIGNGLRLIRVPVGCRKSSGFQPLGFTFFGFDHKYALRRIYFDHWTLQVLARVNGSGRALSILIQFVLLKRLRRTA
jgi:hypothetical protein